MTGSRPSSNDLKAIRRSVPYHRRFVLHFLRNIFSLPDSPHCLLSRCNTGIGCGCPDNGAYDTASPSPYLHGAAMLVKREVIERVGLMPEVYFLYYEELDWCTAMTRAGYTLWYEPRCTVFHKESQSTGQLSVLRTYYLTRNRLLYAWRNLSGADRLLSLVYQMTFAATKNSLQNLLQRRVRQAGAVWRGVFGFIILPGKQS